VTQIDLPEGRGRSGLLAARDILHGIPDLVFVHLDADDVVRHRLVADIVNAYERADSSRDAARSDGAEASKKQETRPS
jgi:phosphate starvation-inducible PhoH-like protein